MKNEMTRICFVRHGETDWNIEQRMQGHIDLALNANGEAQAVAAGRYFAGLQAAALYSSDLQRARQTAQAIADALHLPMILLPALRERHFGRCEGMTFDEIAATNIEDARAIERRDPDYATPGGGESLRQHHARILNCIGELVSAHIGQTIVVVTHGGVLDVIYCRAHGLPPETPRSYPIPNTGINWVGIDGERWVIERWGDTAHLR
ncbi:histidine phosphatase family protein [Propionivibrio sp.]|uniref:histidine phosphatase family protein n=1 Tax=Propionivibrio sp. TaxID=2212460 RepID=UPI0025D5CC61|nr:histidine phosphatase family protein [Propionivibrio sp.]